MFGHVNRTSLNLGELAASPASSATTGISSAGSLLQSEREAIIGAVFSVRSTESHAFMKRKSSKQLTPTSVNFCNYSKLLLTTVKFCKLL